MPDHHRHHRQPPAEFAEDGSTWSADQAGNVRAVNPADGTTTLFGADGSFTVIDADHTTTRIEADNTKTVTSAEGSQVHYDADGWPSRAELPDGTAMYHDRSGTWTSIDGAGHDFTWSERDQRWLHFDPALEGSRWDYDPQTVTWTERSSPDPNRPEGVWVTPDGTRVTEVNGNLFAQSGDHYAYRLGSAGAKEANSTDGWIHSSRELYEQALANNSQLESDKAAPETAAMMRYTDGMLNLTAKTMIWMADVVDKSSYLLLPEFGAFRSVVQSILGRDIVWAEKLSTGERLLPFVPGLMSKLGAFGSLVAEANATRALTAAERAEWIEKAGHATELGEEIHRLVEEYETSHDVLDVVKAALGGRADPDQEAPAGQGEVNQAGVPVWDPPADAQPQHDGDADGHSDGPPTVPASLPADQPGAFNMEQDAQSWPDVGLADQPGVSNLDLDTQNWPGGDLFTDPAPQDDLGAALPDHSWFGDSSTPAADSQGDGFTDYGDGTAGNYPVLADSPDAYSDQSPANDDSLFQSVTDDEGADAGSTQ